MEKAFSRLLHTFVKNKAKRGSKTSRRKPTPFSVAIPSVHIQPEADVLVGELHDDEAGMDMNDGVLQDIDSDTEPMRCGNQLTITLELLHYQIMNSKKKKFFFRKRQKRS